MTSDRRVGHAEEKSQLAFSRPGGSLRYAEVCVTGGLGFIGTHLCLALAARGVRVRCVDRLGAHTRGVVPRDWPRAMAGLPGITPVRLDIGSDSLDAALEGADAVIHLAGLPGVRSGHRFSELWRENTLNTVRLAREAARRGQRFLLASTSSVYGNASQLPSSEHAALSPLNAYALSKLAAEQACLTAVTREDADAVIARLFTVFGEHQRPDMAFARWIDAILSGRPIPWCARTGTARDFTYAGDAVAGLVAALEHGRAGEIYNIAGAGPTPLSDALRVLEGILGRPAQVDRSAPSTGEATVTSGCGRKTAAELGYRPRHSLAEGLERQVMSVLAAQRRKSQGRRSYVGACEGAPREGPNRRLVVSAAPQSASDNGRSSSSRTRARNCAPSAP